LENIYLHWGGAYHRRKSSRSRQIWFIVQQIVGKSYLRTSNSTLIQIIGKLSATNHHFKYIVNCITLAAGCNGMDVSGLCFYDAEMDGSVTIKWENKALICIVNVYGCAVWIIYHSYTLISHSSLIHFIFIVCWTMAMILLTVQ
jgi:hypothetical protein